MDETIIDTGGSGGGMTGLAYRILFIPINILKENWNIRHFLLSDENIFIVNSILS